MPSVHLTDFDESERADYLVVVASMIAAHGTVTSQDIFAVRELCMRYVLGPTARGRVMAAMSTPDREFEQIISHLAGSALKHSLLLDLATMGCLHDGRLEESEHTTLCHISKLLGIDEPQREAIIGLGRALSRAATDVSVETAIQAVNEAGVPTGAIGVAASLHGLGSDHEPARELMTTIQPKA